MLSFKKLFFYFSFWVFVCSVSAQIQLVDDISTPSNDGLLSYQMNFGFSYGGLVGHDALYYMRRDDRGLLHPVYTPLGTNKSLDFDSPSRDVVYAFIAESNNKILALSNSGRLIAASSPGSPWIELLAPPDSLEPTLISVCSNSEGDLFFLYRESHAYIPGVGYSSGKVYMKKANEDLVRPLGYIRTNMYPINSAEDVGFTATSNFVFVRSIFYSQNPIVDCLNIQTGVCQNVFPSYANPVFTIDMVSLMDKLYLYDGNSLTVVSGDSSTMRTIELPAQCIGLELFNNGRFKMKTCDKYIFLKTVVNNQVSLLMLDTTTDTYTIAGAIPWDLAYCNFTTWRGSVFMILSTLDSRVEIWQFDQPNKQKLVQQYSPPSGVENVRIFQNDDYLFWLLNNDLKSMRYTRLLPYSTFDIFSPDLEYKNYVTVYPYSKGFYVSAYSEETKREMFHFANPDPTFVYAEPKQLKIFPNPCNDILNIDFGGHMKNFRIELYDVTGRKVLSESLTENHFSTLDLSSYQACAYVLRLITDEYTKEFKIIKN